VSGYSTVNLKEVDNYGSNFGLPEDNFQLRMARGPLGCDTAGVSYKRLGPGWREPFGHTPQGTGRSTSSSRGAPGSRSATRSSN
jgi:hypothetical protein